MILRSGSGYYVFPSPCQPTDGLHLHCRTNRWGHSPESWAQLWKKVFAEAEGEEWAETRVRVIVTLKEGLELSATDHYLVWSVEII